MTSQPSQKAIAIHIQTKISKGKGSQTIKYGQLTKYNMRNILLEKSYPKYGGETISRPLSKNSN